MLNQKFTLHNVEKNIISCTHGAKNTMTEHRLLVTKKEWKYNTFSYLIVEQRAVIVVGHIVKHRCGWRRVESLSKKGKQCPHSVCKETTKTTAATLYRSLLLIKSTANRKHNNTGAYTVMYVVVVVSAGIRDQSRRTKLNFWQCLKQLSSSTSYGSKKNQKNRRTKGGFFFCLNK